MRIVAERIALTLLKINCVQRQLDGQWSNDTLKLLLKNLRGFITRRVERAEDVDDILQEVMLRMHRGLASVRHEERLGPWLYRLTRNAIADFGRSRTKHPLLAAEQENSPPVEAEQTAHWTVKQEVATYLAAFVEQLPAPYRETLTLTELKGFSQQAVATELGITLSATKARVRRGRVHLKASLEACCAITLDVRGNIVECQPRIGGVPPKGCCQNRQ